MHRALADEHRHALAGIENVGGASKIVLTRDDSRRRVADAGVNCRVFVRRLLVRFLLQIVRQDDASDGALGHRNAKRAIDQVPHLPRRHSRLHELRCDVFEQILQIDFLLIRAPHRQPRGLTDDGYDWLMIELRVVQSIEKVDRAGARSRHADADLAGELRVRAGHERGHLFVAHLDEFDFAAGAIERAEHAVDPIAGIAVDAFHAPVGETSDQEIARGFGHHGAP